MTRRTLCLLTLSAVLMADAGAQQYVYPAKGQSPEQQKRDESACYSWAVQQSGFDPAKPPPQQAPAQPATTASGTTPGAGMRGAARGAIVGSALGGLLWSAGWRGGVFALSALSALLAVGVAWRGIPRWLPSGLSSGEPHSRPS